MGLARPILGLAMAQYGPGPWAGPMGPGPDPGPALGTRTFFRNSILKNLNIAYMIEY